MAAVASEIRRPVGASLGVRQALYRARGDVDERETREKTESEGRDK